MIESDNPDYSDDEEQPTVEELEGVRNLNDSTGEKIQRKRVDNAEEQAAMFWRDIFSTAIGRREMWRLLVGSHPDGKPFSPPFANSPVGFPHPEAQWFWTGQYALGQFWYQRWMQYARDGVLLMLDEHDPRFAKPRPKRRRTSE